MRWPGFDGGVCATRGRVRDVSARGLAVRMHEPLEVGQSVRVRLNQGDYEALIRRCRHDGTSFLAGLEIARPAEQGRRERWSWIFCRHFGEQVL